MLEIPWRRLSEETLVGLIEAYINRDGTDYGEREFSLEEKVQQLKSHLQRGEVVIVFNEQDESCNFMPADWRMQKQNR